MEKIVSSGEQDCTVNLDGTECAVVFSSNYKCFTVQNDTGKDIYISISPNIAAGKDGVRRVISGASSSLAHERNNVDTLYILGTGSVQVVASDTPGNFFRSAPAQNGGVDGYSKSESDERYPLKMDTVPRGLGFGYGYCYTAAATAAKTATIAGTDSPNFTARDGGIVVIKFTNAVGKMSTLNINNSGAGSIFYHGTNIADGIINAGDTVTFVKMGSVYHVVSIENNGNAKTVNGHTVNADVPENAVFTDTVPDLSGYVKQIGQINIGDTFTPYPGQADTNGILTYCEYARKRSDGRADKIFRLGDINGNKFSDLQAYYNGTDTVLWTFKKTNVNVNVLIDNSKVITEATAALQEFGVTPTLTNGTAANIAVSFNPKIVLLFNSGRIITGGYSIAMGTKKFTVTPSAVATMGTTTPSYISFG